MGRWSDRLQDLGRRIADLVRDGLAAVRSAGRLDREPEPVLVPVPVRAAGRGSRPAAPEPRFR